MNPYEFFSTIKKREDEFERRKCAPNYTPDNNYDNPSTWKIVFTPHSAYVWFYKKVKKK